MQVITYDAIVAFLRAHGAMLAAVKPEVMLPFEEYMLLDSAPSSNGLNDRATVKREHAARHTEAWLEVLFQVIRRLLVLHGTVIVVRGAAMNLLLTAVHCLDVDARKAIKVFILGRVTPRAFRALPGMGDAAGSISKEATGQGYSSLLYSTPELLLLRWLEHHNNAVIMLKTGVANATPGTWTHSLHAHHVYSFVAFPRQTSG